MKKIGILAQFPVHLLPGLETLGEPKQHYATWLPQLALSFSKQDDFEIHWVVLTREVDKPTEVQKWGQKFHLLPTAISRRASTFFKADRHALQHVLKSIKPDLVHGWGTEDVYALAAVTSGFPHMISMAGLLSYYVLKSKMHPRDYFQACLELVLLRKADLVTVETEWGRKVLRRRTSRPIELVEYGVRPEFYERTWSPDPHAPTALFVGSIHQRKGIQDAAQAFADPRLQKYRLRVAGAGSGPWVDQLKASAGANVEWLGQISPQHIAAELEKAWCLVLPTRCDTSPNVVKEARVIGLPVVTTPEGGQSDYILDGKNGFLVKPGDVETLADRLNNVLSNRDTCRTLGAGLHEEARQHFRPERTAELLVKIYGELVKS